MIGKNFFPSTKDMAGLSMEMKMVLYALLVIIIAIAGYYIGQMYDYPWTGVIIGVVIGVVIVAIMWRVMGSESEF